MPRPVRLRNGPSPVKAYDAVPEPEAVEFRALVDAFNDVHPEVLRVADEGHQIITRLFGASGPPRGSQRSMRQAAGR